MRRNRCWTFLLDSKHRERKGPKAAEVTFKLLWYLAYSKDFSPPAATNKLTLANNSPSCLQGDLQPPAGETQQTNNFHIYWLSPKFCFKLKASIKKVNHQNDSSSLNFYGNICRKGSSRLPVREKTLRGEARESKREILIRPPTATLQTSHRGVSSAPFEEQID